MLHLHRFEDGELLARGHDIAGRDRQRDHRDEVQMTLRGLYASKKNAAGFGHNGWSTYNAFAEYLDHAREGNADSKAASSMNLNSWVSKRKQLAQKAILSLT